MADKPIAIGQAILDLYYCGFSKEKITEEIESRWPTKDIKEREELISRVIRGIESLMSAIEKAGDSGHFIKEQRYFMSASEFIITLSLNNILYNYTIPQKQILKIIGDSIEKTFDKNEVHEVHEVIILEEDKILLKEEYEELKVGSFIEDEVA